MKEVNSQLFLGCTTLLEVNIPSGVTKIENSAFKGCTYLSEVTLPEGLLTIGYEAFSGSGLRTVRVPDSVQFIDISAFPILLGYKTRAKNL